MRKLPQCLASAELTHCRVLPKLLDSVLPVPLCWCKIASDTMNGEMSSAMMDRMTISSICRAFLYSISELFCCLSYWLFLTWPPSFTPILETLPSTVTFRLCMAISEHVHNYLHNSIILQQSQVSGIFKGLQPSIVAKPANESKLFLWLSRISWDLACLAHIILLTYTSKYWAIKAKRPETSCVEGLMKKLTILFSVPLYNEHKSLSKMEAKPLLNR